MALTRPEDLPGYGVKFSLLIAQYAFAIASANLEAGIGGGSGIDNAALAQAIEDALADPGIITNPTTNAAIAAAIKTALDDGVILDPSTITAIAAAINSSTVKTAGYTSTTTSGTITAGASSVAIANIGSAAGTVLGTSFPANATIEWSANGFDTLGAIAYDATGTEFLISEVR